MSINISIICRDAHAEFGLHPQNCRTEKYILVIYSKRKLTKERVSVTADMQMPAKVFVTFGRIAG